MKAQVYLMRSDRLLNEQANLIEQVVARYKVDVQVTGGWVLPQIIIHRVHLSAGCRLKSLEALTREIAIALRVPGIQISSGVDGVTIEVPRVDRGIVTLKDMVDRLGKAPPVHTALLGIGHDGLPLMIYMPSPNVAHVLVAGTTGSGKTELLRTLVTSLVLWGKRQELGLFLVDPKHRKLAELAGLAPVLETAGARGAAAVLSRLIDEVERRDERGYHEPRIYLVIDEVADLVLVGGRPVEEALVRLLQRGREAGISVIAATQRPSAEITRGLMKANFPVRIAGAVNSAGDAAIATGLPKSGAERLLGKGDMILANHGRILRFQAALTRPDVVRPLVRGDDGESRQAAAPNFQQALASLQQRLGLRGPGRPAEPLDQDLVAWIIVTTKQVGGVSQRAVRRWHQEHRGTDCNPERAQRHIQEAQTRLADGTWLS